jgi:hypothetical protein
MWTPVVATGLQYKFETDRLCSYVQSTAISSNRAWSIVGAGSIIIRNMLNIINKNAGRVE